MPSLNQSIALIADSGEGGFWVGIAGVIAALVAGAIAIIRGRSESQDQKARRESKARRDAMNELYELIDRQAEDIASFRKEIHEVREQANDFRMKLAVCEAQHAERDRRDVERDRRERIMIEALRGAGIMVDLTPSGPPPTQRAKPNEEPKP